jgi:hypothetical protein
LLTGRSGVGAADTTETRATEARRGVKTVGDATTRLGAEARGAFACELGGRPAGGGGSGAARTTVRGGVPVASGGDCGAVSGPSVTTAGSVIAAAIAVPATAAVAMIVRPLLTSSPVSADPLNHGIGGMHQQPKS